MRCGLLHVSPISRALLFHIVVLLMGCSGAPDDTSPDCTDGDSKDCNSTSGGSSSTSSTNTDTSTETNTDLPALGTSCSTDQDCPKKAQCLTTDSTSWLGGAPPEGICVADCSLDDQVCKGFANATCIESLREGAESSGTGISRAMCLPSCSPKDGSLKERSCSAVPGTLCEPLSEDGTGVCRPVCSFDSQCASKHCDLQLGVCVSEATNYGTSFGNACTTDNHTCNGVCLTLSSGYEVCSNRCTFGGRDACDGITGSSIASACAYASFGGGLGDLGYCAQLCDCDDDCAHEQLVCETFANESVRTALGHQGLCTAPMDHTGAKHEGTPCETTTP
jgi:hypothetical protein